MPPFYPTREAKTAIVHAQENGNFPNNSAEGWKWTIRYATIVHVLATGGGWQCALAL